MLWLAKPTRTRVVARETQWRWPQHAHRHWRVINQPVDLLLANADERAEATAIGFHEQLPVSELVSRARATFSIAAQALLTVDRVHNPETEDTEERFREEWYDVGRIPEGVGFTFFAAFREDVDSIDQDRLRRLVEESGLFVEEVHSIVGKVRGLALKSAGGTA